MFELEYLCRTALVLADKARLMAHQQRQHWAKQSLLEKMRDSGVVDMRRLGKLE